MTENMLATFRVAGLFMGMNVEHVQEVCRDQEITPVPLAPAGVIGLINLRGQLATALDARKRLGLPPADGDGPVVSYIIRTGTGPVALMVDEEGEVLDPGADAADDVPETVADPLRSLLTGVHDLDGRLLLVLDVDRLTSVGAG